MPVHDRSLKITNIHIRLIKDTSSGNRVTLCTGATQQGSPPGSRTRRSHGNYEVMDSSYYRIGWDCLLHLWMTVPPSSQQSPTTRDTMIVWATQTQSKWCWSVPFPLTVTSYKCWIRLQISHTPCKILANPVQGYSQWYRGLQLCCTRPWFPLPSSWLGPSLTVQLPRGVYPFAQHMTWRHQSTMGRPRHSHNYQKVFSCLPCT